jgi:anti-sigma regulatory factor (Ser/Thr protein kinase)
MVAPTTLGSRTFASQIESVREGRSFVRDCLRDTAADVDNAVLLASELATNAVIHANSGYQIDVRRSTTSIRVELLNDEPAVLPMLSEPTEDGGRGLRIVEALASSWGMESDADHKMVWFELQDPD